MKVAYFGCDLFKHCLDIFVAHDHEIIAIFAASGDKQSSQMINHYADENNIPCFTGKPDKQVIQDLENRGVQCFFSIEYNYLIPLPSCQVKTMNVHPTLLPQGRGPTPLSHLILEYPQHAGVTIHKLAKNFDEGDIILQSAVQLDQYDSLESLLVKLHYQIPQLLNAVLSDFQELYQQALPQGDGSYWAKLTDKDRLINWLDSNNNIQRMIRAFGRFGVVCYVNQEIWLVNHVEIVATQHTSEAGKILTDDAKVCVVTITEGLAIIFKDSIIEKRSIADQD